MNPGLGEVPEASWTLSAACAASKPDDLFVQGAAQRDARRVCFGCAVRMDCLADALEAGVQFGVWGGMTERERRALVRRAGRVSSWADRLQADVEIAATFATQRQLAEDGQRAV